MCVCYRGPVCALFESGVREERLHLITSLSPEKFLESMWIPSMLQGKYRVSLNRQGWERVKFMSVSRAIYARNKRNVFIIDLGRPSFRMAVNSFLAIF